MNTQVIGEFRANEGRAGGMFEGTPLILVHHVGARSGVARIAPLAYLEEDGRLFVFASKGGAPYHPDWYHNLVANPETSVEVGTEKFKVTAKVLTGTERDEVYARMSAVQPQFADYQAKTERTIPVVELVRAA
ncbi:nitroreductase family deazaflavin-dependent oxidoreductase [Actinoalloteichus hymeniacidonis]|nr:nitroreductase family deazaflavin-dependent oxidoreductase [Actinoalloteichus hymeniacidonis]MBB5907370.1 deazaflavin-dependent oxidoreductase (nitroreductase family) [Actinoalloteichus hymeniacidonis]